MKIYCDEKEIAPAALVTFEGMKSDYHKMGADLECIEGSHTKDTLRYSRNNSQFPLELAFVDKYDHKWKVVVENKSDNINMFIPCGYQILLYGADESPSRTASDAETQWALLQITGQEKTFLSPSGVRIGFTGYKERNAGEWSVYAERWSNIMDLVKKGTKINGDVAEQIEKGV